MKWIRPKIQDIKINAGRQKVSDLHKNQWAVLLELGVLPKGLFRTPSYSYRGGRFDVSSMKRPL